jgi:hypothetical protein
MHKGIRKFFIQHTTAALDPAIMFTIVLGPTISSLDPPDCLNFFWLCRRNAIPSLVPKDRLDLMALSSDHCFEPCYNGLLEFLLVLSSDRHS